MLFLSRHWDAINYETSSGLRLFVALFSDATILAPLHTILFWGDQMGACWGPEPNIHSSPEALATTQIPPLKARD